MVNFKIRDSDRVSVTFRVTQQVIQACKQVPGNYNSNWRRLFTIITVVNYGRMHSHYSWIT